MTFFSVNKIITTSIFILHTSNITSLHALLHICIYFKAIDKNESFKINV